MPSYAFSVLLLILGAFVVRTSASLDSYTLFNFTLAHLEIPESTLQQYNMALKFVGGKGHHAFDEKALKKQFRKMAKLYHPGAIAAVCVENAFAPLHPSIPDPISRNMLAHKHTRRRALIDASKK